MKVRDALLQLLVASAAVLLALGVGAAIIAARGHSPIDAYATMFSESLGEPMPLGQILFKATTLVFTGVAAAFAFRAGMFNIGGEGQLYLGAFFCAVAGLLLPAGTPGAVAVPLLVLAAFLGGAVAAAPPAVLKATRGTHEVINTMMMNFIIAGVVSYFVGRLRSSPETVHTKPILDAGRLPLLSSFVDPMKGSDANLATLIAVLACAAVFYFLTRTKTGYEFRAVGYSPGAAEYGGVSVPRVMLMSLLVSGGLAGLGGVNYVMGSQGYFEKDFAPYQGFLGIAVALLARNHPIGVIPAAFMFALLSEGGQTIQKYVPKEIGEILQAVMILFVVLGAKLLERAKAALARRKAAHA